MKLLLLLSVIGMAGCATVREMGASMMVPAHLRYWTDHGFTLAEAKEWEPTGFGILTVGRLREMGCTPKEALEWQALKMGGDEVVQWRAANFLPSEVAEWRKSGFEPQEARDRKNAGFSAAQAAEWGTYTLEAIDEWRQAGCSPSDARSFDQEGIRSSELLEWKKAGLGMQDINQWSERFSDLHEAIGWKKAGFSLKQTKDWDDMYYEEAAPWKKAGFTPGEARLWRHIGDTTPAQARNYKKACPKGVGLMGDLVQTNPYDCNGRCYQYIGETLQILNRTTGLYKAGNDPVYIDFGEASAPPNYYQGMVKGTGTFEYVDTFSRKRIVPKLKTIR
jgi:hypothetical protein